MIVVCLSSHAQSRPICLCFACQEAFPEPLLRMHMESLKHVINALLYWNPWLLPFGWHDQLDIDNLRLVMSEEEKKRGQNKIFLKILDVPHWIFDSLCSTSYRTVIAVLEFHNHLLRRGVPPRETYSKLEENERFPLLGRQFLVSFDECVRHDQSSEYRLGFLCLLCKTKLKHNDYCAHVFSWKHVTEFLEAFHPDSLKGNPATTETLLDLAKQAAQIHSIASIQDIRLPKPIVNPYTYAKAIFILDNAKRREKKGPLTPLITRKAKLVPRCVPKEVKKDHINSSKKITECESGKTPTKAPVSQSEVNTEQKQNGSSQPHSQGRNDVKNSTSTIEKPSGPTKAETLKICQTLLNANGEQTSNSANDEHTGCKRKKLRNKSPNLEDSLPDENFHKRPRLISSDKAVCEEPEKMPNSCHKKVKLEEGESSESRKITVTEKGKVVPEKDVNSHISENKHQNHPMVVKMETDADSGAEVQLISMSEVTGSIPKTADVIPGSTTATLIETVPAFTATASKCAATKSKPKEAGASLMDTFSTETTSNIFSSVNHKTLVPTAASVTDLAAPLSSCASVACKSEAPDLASTSGETIPNTCSYTESSKPLETKTRAAPSPHPESKATLEAIHETKAAPKDSSKCAAVSQTLVPSVASTPMECQMNAKTINIQNSAGPEAKVETSIHLSNMLSEIHMSTIRDAQRESKNPSTKPVAATVPKNQPTVQGHLVGMSQLIRVCCEGMEQVYCLLCCVKLKGTGHLMRSIHQYNYLKFKFPEMEVNPVELNSKLVKIVAHLAEVEKQIGLQKPKMIRLNRNMYDEVAALPDNMAVQQLKVVVQGDSHVQIPSTYYIAEASQQQITSPEISQRNTSNPEDGQPATHSPSKETSVLMPETDQETPECRQQLITELEGKETLNLEDPQRKSPSVVIGHDLHNTAASVRTEQQNTLVPSQKSESSPEDSVLRPGHHAALPKYLRGKRTMERSHLYSYLTVIGMRTESIIGLSSLWEIRGTFLNSRSLYLCESCNEMFFICEICQHMVTELHQIKYMRKEFPVFMKIWNHDDISTENKIELSKAVTQNLSAYGFFKKMDAKVIHLEKESYDYVLSASISEALNFLKLFTENETLNIPWPFDSPQQKIVPPVHSQGQQSKDQNDTTHKDLN